MNRFSLGAACSVAAIALLGTAVPTQATAVAPAPPNYKVQFVPKTLLHFNAHKPACSLKRHVKPLILLTGAAAKRYDERDDVNAEYLVKAPKSDWKRSYSADPFDRPGTPKSAFFAKKIDRPGVYQFKFRSVVDGGSTYEPFESPDPGNPLYPTWIEHQHPDVVGEWSTVKRFKVTKKHLKRVQTKHLKDMKGCQ
ncbi:MAG: hypothetical protein WC054_13720 [Candidatus Nanopelagicales bacterium]